LPNSPEPQDGITDLHHGLLELDEEFNERQDCRVTLWQVVLVLVGLPSLYIANSYRPRSMNDCSGSS
jgi:hypothetical protein